MSLVDWILFVVCWSLIPAVLAMRVILDMKAAKSERECWRKVKELHVSRIPREDGSR